MGPGRNDLGSPAPEESPVVVVRDEADLLALGRLGGGQAEPAGLRAHLVLHERADGKAGGGQLLLGQRPEKVGLILPRVAAAPEQVASRRLVAGDARIVAGRHRHRVPRPRAGEQRAELDLAIARHAGHGRAARRVLARELLDDRRVELALAIENIVGNAELPRDVPRSGHRLRRAAGAEALGPLLRGAPGPDAQGHAHDVIALLDEERGGDGRVDASAHAHDQPLGHRPRRSR